MIAAITMCLLGTALGFLAGLLPGIGTSTMIVIFFSFLVHQDILSLLVFYASLINASQYAGSITAFVFGIPGENSSLPIIELREKLRADGHTAEAIAFTAVGSFVGAMLIFVLTLSILDIAAEYTFYLRSWIAAATGVTGIILAVVFSDNKIVTSALLVTAGWLLSKVGIDWTTQKEFMTFGNDYLRGGVPNITVLLGLFVLPNFLKFANVKIDKDNSIDINLITRLSGWKSQAIVIFRSSAFGFILGLIPYIGTNLSSSVAYYVERWFRPRDHLSQAVAAESANNAASISVLIPMLLFGIAIQVGEGMILDIINMSSRSLSWSIVATMMPMIAGMIVLSNIISLIIAWPLVVYSIKFMKIASDYMPMILGSICVYTAWTLGSQSLQGEYYIICLAVFCGVGTLIRKIDTMPLVFAFLLQDTLEPAIVRTMKIISTIF